jgi:murein DD-endopeptidase MepM/ murein hydrolase activator NlpD
MGVDVAGPAGRLVVAAGGGVVVGSQNTEIFGNELLIEHGKGISTFYGHNRELLVAVGDSVRAGQPVARVGSTGQSSAPHLHFEVRVDGVPVDPGDFIKEYRVTRP